MDGYFINIQVYVPKNAGHIVIKEVIGVEKRKDGTLAVPRLLEIVSANPSTGKR